MFNMRKILIFLSSYIPLYILLIGKNIFSRIERINHFKLFSYNYKGIIWFNQIDDCMIVVFLVLTVVLFLWLKKFLKPVSNGHKYIIQDFENETDKYFFSYISIYFLPCIGLSINSITDIFILVSIMLIVGYVYVTNDLIYINPTMSMLGYKIYSVQLVSVMDGMNSEFEERYVLVHKHKERDLIVGNMIFISNAKKYCLLQDK